MLKKINDENIFKFILNNLREEDLCELITSKGENWFNETLETIKSSNTIVLFIKTNRGKFVPIAMGGFEPCCDNGKDKTAIVWLLATKYIDKYKFIFWKELRNYFKQEETKYTILFNFIYKTNFQAKNWLRLLGFKFDNPKPTNIYMPENFEFFYKIINRKEK